MTSIPSKNSDISLYKIEDEIFLIINNIHQNVILKFNGIHVIEIISKERKKLD